jgi:hypothetical protein
MPTITTIDTPVTSGAAIEAIPTTMLIIPNAVIRRPVDWAPLAIWLMVFSLSLERLLDG